MEYSQLSKKVVLDRMIEELPQDAWADIEILDWLAEDDKLPIEYSFATTLLARVLVADTPKGICYLGFVQGDDQEVLLDFNKRFRHAIRVDKQTPRQKQVLNFLDGVGHERILFHLRGTPYQTEIWRRLIRIPYGKVISYATLGGSAPYARAAGTANGRNPIFWIIPCHRAVKTDGGFDRYFWGEDVKKKMLEWEFTNDISQNKRTLPDK